MTAGRRGTSPSGCPAEWSALSHVHTNNQKWTRQVVFMFVHIYICAYIYMHVKIKKKRLSAGKWGAWERFEEGRGKEK